ncbi:MAG: transpeptidase family protein [Acidobacteria bacterium]|nr:transpeptidase family protein [Acidobacteriota bacterium]
MKKDKSLAGRVYVLITVMGLWGAAIGTRLYFLHVVHSADYKHRAERQQQRKFEVSPRRGVIYDRKGNELAVSVKVDSVFAVPDDVRNPAAAAKKLSPLTGIPKDDLIEKLESGRSFVWIKRKVGAAEAAAIQKEKIPGIYFQKEDRRYYPKRDLAAHVLGYVSIDEEGQGGLEYRYNESVRGEAGRVLIMTDARGRSFNSVEQSVEPGANLVTTIDQNIQYIVEKELKAAVQQMRPKGASAIAMDPKSGEILAMANYPSFNPNEHAKYRRDAWINRAVSHTYEPGSTFKIVTLTSALEEGLADPADVIDCQMGIINVFGRIVHDHKPFGLLTVTEIMQKSSDVGAIKLAMRLGDGRFADYIGRLGFGNLSNVDLPGEERGLAKPASRWTKSSVGSIAMGQEIGVTPLQIVRMISAVANGGILYRPYVVKRVEHPQNGVLGETESHGERVISSETAAKVQNMLEVVVTDGTAVSGKLEGYTAAGKTGTAQKIDETGRYSKTAHVASFAGYAPASNPVVSIIVVVDEPVYGQHHGSQVAPVFKRIAEQVLRYMSVPPDVPSYAPQYTFKEARSPEPEAGINAGQRPQSGRFWLLASGSGLTSEAVFSELGGIPVPDFHGKSLREVAKESLKAGLRLQSIGSGAAVEQMPPPGANVRAGSRIQVRFSSKVER